MKYYFEMGKIEKYWIEQFCFGKNTSCVRYQKEEAGIYHPDNMLPDGTIDEKLEK